MQRRPEGAITAAARLEETVSPRSRGRFRVFFSGPKILFPGGGDKAAVEIALKSRFFRIADVSVRTGLPTEQQNAAPAYRIYRKLDGLAWSASGYQLSFFGRP